MDKNQSIILLKEQVEKIDSLRHPPAYNPQYSIWDDTTKRLIDGVFDKKYLDMYKYSGPNRIAMGDEEHYQFFIETLNAKKELLNGFIEEYGRFNPSDSISTQFPNGFQNYDFHPKVKQVSSALLQDGHNSQAIEESLKMVIKRTKDLLKTKTGEELDGDRLMNRMFGCENQEPVVKFNNISTIEEKDEQKGIMNLFKGIVGIRNRKAHDNVLQGSYDRAVEYLAIASLLMGLLDDFSEQ